MIPVLTALVAVVAVPAHVPAVLKTRCDPPVPEPDRGASAVTAERFPDAVPVKAPIKVVAVMAAVLGLTDIFVLVFKG